MMVKEQPLLCMACGCKWEGELLVDVPAAIWIAVARATSCPRCGAGWKRIHLRLERPEPPEATAPEAAE